MHSFLELPRLAFDGRDIPSVYVNTADIVVLNAEYDGQTSIHIRDYGAAGLGIVKTYVPLNSLLDVLGELAKFPGVRSWTADTVAAWKAPVVRDLAALAARERAAR
jgi:hypothetical protein